MVKKLTTKAKGSATTDFLKKMKELYTLSKTPENKEQVLKDLHVAGYKKATIIGKVISKQKKPVVLRGENV